MRISDWSSDVCSSDLESFSKNANATRSATADYTDELEQHVAELDQVQGTGQILSSLADLAKAMLERTRKLETDMRRSEEEAKALRRSLEQARREAEIDHMTRSEESRVGKECVRKCRSRRSTEQKTKKITQKS